MKLHHFQKRFLDYTGTIDFAFWVVGGVLLIALALVFGTALSCSGILGLSCRGFGIGLGLWIVFIIWGLFKVAQHF